jgi:aminopeptidase Y
VAAASLALAGGITAAVGTAAAASPACDSRTNNTVAKLTECVTVDGVMEHLQAFQSIADANGGTRVAGTAGYDASVDYVSSRLRAAGWQVTLQPFEFQTFINRSRPVLERVSPPPTQPIDINIMSYSGSGDVTAAATTPSVVTGCHAPDFAGFPSGAIALIQRGGCTFGEKATNAQAAGAAGVVIYNNADGNINGTLGEAFTLDVPVVSVSKADGEQLAATPGLVLHLKTDTFRGRAATSNVIAELPGKNRDNVVMAGSHLDSVDAGPGINDNGSASASLLEIAENLGKVTPQNTLRFAWWSAEESGLVGSTRYVESLSDAELDKVALYLNFDMVASPNYVLFIYDGDDSDGVGAGPGPEGSAQIEKTFEQFFTSRSLPFKGSDFTGRSDYGPFIAAGIPSGGLFTGAEGVKTAEEAAIWGGTAGESYDACYHQECDTIGNVNRDALDANSDAIAHATLSYAMSTTLINGTKSKGNFRSQAEPHETVR